MYWCAASSHMHVLDRSVVWFEVKCNVHVYKCLFVHPLVGRCGEMRLHFP